MAANENDDTPEATPEDSQPLFSETPQDSAPPTTPWCEEMNDANEAPHDPGERPEEIIEVPLALRYLEKNGVRFTPVSKYAFLSTGIKSSINKSLSIYFTVDTVVTSHDIIFGFDSAGIDVDEITSIQRKGSNRSWVVSFASPAAKEHALEIPSVTICDLPVFLGDCENRTVLVKIYEAPEEMPDTFVIGRLYQYGAILSFRRDLLASGIHNGIRTARMRLTKHIPSSIYIAGEQVFISYQSQPRTCRKCGEESHQANTCTSYRCFNCEGAGHRIEDCHELAHCKICSEVEHSTSRCPFLIHSGNIQLSAPGDNSYAETTKAGTAGNEPKEKSKEKPKERPKEKQNSKSNNSNATSHPREQRPHARDREREREKEKEQEREKERRREQEHRQREREKERERDRERERQRDRERDRDRQRRDRDDRHDRARDRERDHDRERRRDWSRYSDDEIEEFSTDENDFKVVRYRKKPSRYR